jgi:hypothetical protein
VPAHVATCSSRMLRENCRSQFDGYTRKRSMLAPASGSKKSQATQPSAFRCSPATPVPLVRGFDEWSILLRLILGIELVLRVPRKEPTDGSENRDLHWRSIAERLSNEVDPAKSGILVEQLLLALDQRDGVSASATILTSELPANSASSSRILLAC